MISILFKLNGDSGHISRNNSLEFIGNVTIKYFSALTFEILIQKGYA